MTLVPTSVANSWAVVVLYEFVVILSTIIQTTPLRSPLKGKSECLIVEITLTHQEAPPLCPYKRKLTNPLR